MSGAGQSGSVTHRPFDSGRTARGVWGSSSHTLYRGSAMIPVSSPFSQWSHQRRPS